MRRPIAEAHIKGSAEHPQLKGKVLIYPAEGGSVIVIEAAGLPQEVPFIAVHLHEGRACTGNMNDAFANAGLHLNFELLGHPLHTGDFPALLNNNGYAWSAFYTNRFSPKQVIGYPVVIHAHSDDYHTQPSGDSGSKIGCGIIRAI